MALVNSKSKFKPRSFRAQTLNHQATMPLCVWQIFVHILIVKVKNHSTKKKKKKPLLTSCLAYIACSSYFYSLILHRENVTNLELPQTYITAMSCPLDKSQTVFLLAWPCFSSQNRSPPSDLLVFSYWVLHWT